MSTVQQKKPIVEIMREQSDKGKIIIDPSVSLEDAIRFIDLQMRSEQQVVEYSDIIDTYPTDGANALFEVMKATYGMIEQKAIETFWGKEPPEVRSIQVGYYEYKEVPWGKMALPGIKGDIFLGARQEKGLWKFYVTAKVIKRDILKVKELVANTRRYLQENSIYQGHPLRLEWVEQHSFFGKVASFDIPKFLAPTFLNEQDIVLPHDIWAQVDAGIFSLIKNHSKAVSMGVPSKRLTILAGPYGTGKTLTAAITGELCRKVGRTFWYLANIEKLPEAIHLAAQYSPSMIFAEDIDKVTDPNLVDAISNTIDGVDTKAIDVMFVMTTNHLERLPKKFLRSGRSDMIVKFTPPDAKAAGKLIIKYAGKTLDPKFTAGDAEEIGRMLASEEMIPASIREVVERSKLFAIAGNRDLISAEDIKLASLGVIEQCELLKEHKSPTLPDGWRAESIVIGRVDEDGDGVDIGNTLEFATPNSR